MTPYVLFQEALLDAGVISEGQTPSAQTMNTCLLALNSMLSQWNRKRWLIYQTVDTYATATGATSYTVGAAQTFNVARPDRIEAAFARLLNSSTPVDYPLNVLESREDYNRIALKTLQAPPSVAWYDPGFPIGRVYFWPVPPAGLWEMHITTKQVLAQVADYRTEISLPAEYEEALRYNLVQRLCISFGMPISDDIKMLARGALATIRTANAQVAQLQMPSPLLANSVRYNILGDTYQ